MYKLVKESQYFVAWICYFVCRILVGAIAGGLAGGTIGIVLGMMGVDLRTIAAVSAVAGFIISVPVSYLCFRFFVGKMIVEKIEDDLHEVIDAYLEQPAGDVEGSHGS